MPASWRDACHTLRFPEATRAPPSARVGFSKAALSVLDCVSHFIFPKVQGRSFMPTKFPFGCAAYYSNSFQIISSFLKNALDAFNRFFTGEQTMKGYGLFRNR